MKLLALGKYHNPRLSVACAAGETLNIDDVLAALVQADAPENFELVLPEPDAPAAIEPEQKAPAAPPVDKAVQQPAKAK